MTWLLILLPLVAYCLGSVSFAYLAGRAKGIDLREHGSGNLGATNAGRVLGAGWFAAVFCCDVAKGALPVLGARFLPGLLEIETSVPEHQLLQIAAGAGAILGHVFTLFHHFRGGKAVATSLGVLIALLPQLAGCLAATWILFWACGRFLFRAKASAAVGPASAFAALTAPGWWWLLREDPLAAHTRILTAFVAVLTVLIVVRHRSNLRKMVVGARQRRNAAESESESESESDSKQTSST